METISPSAVRTAHELRMGLSRLRRRLREAYDRRELTPSQTSVLGRLDRDGPSTASALAAAERVRPQSVAATLAVLEERDLVGRRPDPTDGRRQVVSLTTAGQAYLADSRRAGEEWLARALEDRYSEDERATIGAALALLERLTA